MQNIYFFLVVYFKLHVFVTFFKINSELFRSISMVGEKERKMLKEIVKKAKNPVKHRVIPPGIKNSF